MTTFAVDAETSYVMIEARSSVGPIYWKAGRLSGIVEVATGPGGFELEQPVSGHLDVDMDALSSGNDLYDAELLRRIDARRFPTATIELRSAMSLGVDRFELEGDLTLHGVTRRLVGTTEAVVGDDGALRVRGEQTVDVRDFAIPTPTILMLKIFPDVRVRLNLECRPPNLNAEP